MFKKILTALDNSSYSDYGMDAAVAVAKAYGAEVTGCHVYAARLHEGRFMDMEAGLPERYQSEAVLKRQRDIHESLISKGLNVISDSYLDRFDKQCRDVHVSFNRKSREGKNFVEILNEAEEGGYDLVVKNNTPIKGNIIVGIDGSPYSYWGLMVAIEFKKAFGCEIEAVAAFDPYFHQVAFRNIADALSEDAAKVFRFKEQEKLHDEII